MIKPVVADVLIWVVVTGLLSLHLGDSFSWFIHPFVVAVPILVARVAQTRLQRRIGRATPTSAD